MLHFASIVTFCGVTKPPPELNFLHHWEVFWFKLLGKSSLQEKRNFAIQITGAYTKTFLRDERQPEVRPSPSLPVDMRPSKTSLCKLPYE